MEQDIKTYTGDDIYKAIEERVGLELALAFKAFKVGIEMQYEDVQIISEADTEDNGDKVVRMFICFKGGITFCKIIQDPSGEIRLEDGY